MDLSGVGDRIRLESERLRRLGAADLARRVLRRVERRLGDGDRDLPLFPDDIATPGAPPAPARAVPQGPLTIAWVCTPPSAGSGGHTTMFRMIAGLEAAGHRCRILLYDRWQGNPERQAQVIRDGWPWVSAPVVDIDAPGAWDGLDAAVATAWQTAHALVSRRPADLPGLYFVQDFEPFFYARGSLGALATQSYLLDLRVIALGEMPARHVRVLGVEPDVVPFGCDGEVYRLLPGERERRGVVVYAKPGVERRGYLLTRLALERFHTAHPDEPIHVVGDPTPDLAVPHVHHGSISPAALNELYNQVRAGLAISFTNITLVAEEMLSAGAIPVINDDEDARVGLEHPEVVWAPATPAGLATALGEIVTGPDRTAAAATGVRTDWVPAQEGVRAAVERAVGRG